MKKIYFIFSLLWIAQQGIAAKSNSKEETADTAISVEQLLAKLDTFHYQQTGRVNLGAVAALNIPAGFKFLDGAQAASVLHDVWKNPYAPSLGMLLPETESPFSPTCWAVDITYSEDGHVKDDDAKDFKPDELLSTLQKQIQETNPERVRLGSKALELTGWAEPPYYDSKTHKLYWAKKLREVGDSVEFLNYNIRVLGRKGVLVLNAIGALEQLPEIKLQTPAILDATNFAPGNTYGEFNSSMDKVAAYGIVGLIAGGVLAKTGLFAKLGIILLKFLKPVLLGAAALFGGVMRFFRGKKPGEGQ